jgi:hypothetical protein
MPAVKPQVPKGEPDAASAVEGRRGVGERVDERLRPGRDEGARRWRLADMRASLSDEALATLRHRAEEALAANGVPRMRLGYEVLGKLKVDELLEREELPVDARVSRRS